MFLGPQTAELLVDCPLNALRLPVESVQFAEAGHPRRCLRRRACPSRRELSLKASLSNAFRLIPRWAAAAFALRNSVSGSSIVVFMVPCARGGATLPHSYG